MVVFVVVVFVVVACEPVDVESSSIGKGICEESPDPLELPPPLIPESAPASPAPPSRARVSGSRRPSGASRTSAWPVRNGWSKNSSKPMRSTGFRLSKPLSMETHSRLSAFATLEGIFASERSMFRSSCMGFTPVNGGRPTRSSYRIVPTDHRSALASYFW